MTNSTGDLTLAQIGAIFNDATTQMLGGVYDGNRAAIVNDLATVRADISQLLLAHPDQFHGQSAVHLDIIDRQLTLEIETVRAVGAHPLAPKELNDIHRDIIDIVQGDQTLQTAAADGGANGFAPLPPLLVKPAPFHDNADQTSFLNHYIADATSLSERATALVANPSATPAQTHQLIHDIQAFAQNANTFSLAQGGIYSARFNNEFVLNGTNGAVTHDLIAGLKTGNAEFVNAAAQVLTANAADVAGNNTPVGGGTFNTDPVAAAAAAGAGPVAAGPGDTLQGAAGHDAHPSHAIDDAGAHVIAAHHDHHWG